MAEIKVNYFYSLHLFSYFLDQLTFFYSEGSEWTADMFPWGKTDDSNKKSYKLDFCVCLICLVELKVWKNLIIEICCKVLPLESFVETRKSMQCESTFPPWRLLVESGPCVQNELCRSFLWDTLGQMTAASVVLGCSDTTNTFANGRRCICHVSNYGVWRGKYSDNMAFKIKGRPIKRCITWEGRWQLYNQAVQTPYKIPAGI